uniref:RAP domain-containing protein n=3 Tax=Chrysotila carterae TaxID=13221 RepID=A0A7S4F7S9_CHRCT
MCAQTDGERRFEHHSRRHAARGRTHAALFCVALLTGRVDALAVCRTCARGSSTRYASRMCVGPETVDERTAVLASSKVATVASVGGAESNATCTGSEDVAEEEAEWDPRLLTNMLTKANSSEELLLVYNESGSIFNDMHVCAFWSRFGKLMRNSASEREWLRAHRESLDPIREQTARMLPQFETRSLSNTAHGLASAGMRYVPPWTSLWDTLAAASEANISAFDPRNLANLMWAMATAGCKTPSLYDGVASASCMQMDDFTPQGISNLAWAFARVGHPAPELFTAIANRTIPILSEFSPQGISMTAWAFANAQQSEPALFDAVADAMAAQIEEASPQSIAITAWTFATSGHESPKLFAAIEAEACKRIHLFNAQGLPNLAWAFATAGIPAPRLFDAVAAATPALLKRFTPQGLTNMVWAFAKAAQPAPALFQEVSEELLLRVDDRISSQELANICWAYATAGHHAPALFDALAPIITRRAAQFNAQETSNLLWAFATTGQDAPVLFETLAKDAQGRLHEFNEQGLTNVVWSLAIHGKAPLELTSALAVEVRAKLPNFKPQGLVNTAWAFSTFGRTPAGLFEAILAEAETRLGEFNTLAISSLVWSATNIGVVSRTFFDAVAEQLALRPEEFGARELPVVAWALATIGYESPEAFAIIADAAVPKLGNFTPQSLANFAWAFANMAYTSESLFLRIGEQMALRLESLKVQELSNSAWAFAVADVRSDAFFGSDAFVDACTSKECNEKQLCQLHQWSLWCDEIDAPWPRLPDEFRQKCNHTFSTLAASPSNLQGRVCKALQTLGLQPEEELHVEQGYSIDLTVDWGNERVRIEVDGPGHFLPNSRSPLGSTLLKRRQLQRFGHKLLSLPYWELEMLDHPNALTRRQLQCEYLSYKLDELTGMRLAARGDGWVVIDTALMDRRPELFEESDEVAADAEGTQSGARDEDDEDDDDDDDDDDDGMGAEADAVAEDTGGQAVRRRPERYLRHQALNDEALDALLQEVLTANGITPNWIPSSTGPPRADLDEPTAIVDAE